MSSLWTMWDAMSRAVPHHILAQTWPMTSPILTWVPCSALIAKAPSTLAVALSDPYFSIWRSACPRLSLQGPWLYGVGISRRSCRRGADTWVWHKNADPRAWVWDACTEMDGWLFMVNLTAGMLWAGLRGCSTCNRGSEDLRMSNYSPSRLV